MDILVFLIPVSLSLGALGLLAFLWTLRSGQFSDPEGDAARILLDDEDLERFPSGPDRRSRGKKPQLETPACLGFRSD